MARIMISGIAEAYADDPASDSPVGNSQILASLHGLCSDETCREFLNLDDLDDVVIGGGRLRFVYDRAGNALRITTCYDVTRDLTDDERERLVEETVAQWSDGMGSGSFASHEQEVLSTSLGRALKNSYGDDIEIGDVFVNAFPFTEDQDVQIAFFPDGGSDDDLIADLRIASEAGNANAMFELGQKYKYGDGIEQNDAEAFTLLHRSGELGNLAGMTMAALCLQRGQGCSEDISRAFELFQSAAAEDFPLALHCLGECYAEGYGVPKDPAKAVELYAAGADQDDPGCLAELGDCLEFGKGVEIDLDEALSCYQRALERGFESVEPAIERINAGKEN